MTPDSARNKRWRKRNPEARQRHRRANYAQTQGAPNTGKHWTERDDRTLLEWTGTDRELSAELARSVQAIQVRRTRITRDVRQ